MLSVLLIAMFAFASPALADDDDDDSDDVEYAAYIYEGTVENFADRPVEEVGELDSIRDDDDDDVEDVWSVVGNEGPAPDPLYGEDDEDIDLTIEEMTAAPHVLVIHADDDPGSAVIAAGAIEGDVESDGTLTIDLEEVDGSGFEGRAQFGPDDDDDDDDGDETEVTIGVWQVAAGGA